MKSYLEPICQILESNPNTNKSTVDIISQFISTSEIDSQVLYSFSIDPLFPSFVRHLTTEAVIHMNESAGITAVSDFSSSIFQYLSMLSTKHPVLHDIITSNTNLDDVILSFHNCYIANKDVRSISAPLIFPYIKFISILAVSEHVDLVQPKNLDIIFMITSLLLENPQLSAWASAIIAGLVRNCPAAQVYLKTMPNLLQIKGDLSNLFSNNDICIVCAALSATIALFPIGTDAISALRASTHFIASDSQFQLLLPLASLSIRDLIKKTKLTEEELTTILMTAITAKGYNAYTLFHLLCDLTEYHSAIASIIKTTEYLETLFVSLLAHEEEFVAESGCHFLLCLSDCDSNLFSGLNETDLFATIFTSMVDIPASESSIRGEPYTILLRLLFKSGPPKRTDVALLTQFEDIVFTSFLRYIENNHSYLAVSFFLFILQCAKYIKGWTMRMKRIVIDSVFPALVVNVLNESENRHATEDSLETLKYFCTCKEQEFFGMFISAYVLMVTQTKERRRKGEEERQHLLYSLKTMKIEKEKNCNQIDSLNQIISQNSQVMSSIKEENSNPNLMNHSVNQLHSTDKVRELHAQIKNLRQQVNMYSNKYEKKKKLAKKLKGENDVLLKQIQANQNEIKPSLHSMIETCKNETTERSIHQISRRNFTNEESSDKIATLQKVIYDDSQKIAKLESEYRIQKEQNEMLEKELSKSKGELSKELDHSNQLQSDLSKVESQNNQYRTTQKEINHIKRKYAAKKVQLVERLNELEKEKGKWESLAKFYQKLCQSKGEAVKEIYHVFS